MTGPSAAHPEEPERVVIRDRRRIQPTGDQGGKHTTEQKPDHKPKHKRPEPEPEPAAGELAPPAAAPAEPATEPGSAPSAAAPGLGAELEALRTALDERTRDLQRVTAEYANYRKRVERDRALVGEQATRHVLGALLPVLDDLDRARDHGELVEGVAAVAEQLIATTTKFGLTAFGEKGDPFDPTRHEAVAHLTSPDVTTSTCVDVLRRGYLLGDRLLRPAMVAVAEPAESS